MKRIISKIMLTVLVISSLPMHASLAQTVRNGARTLLQGAGNNSGRIAGAFGGICAIALSIVAYNTYKLRTQRIAFLKSEAPKLEDVEIHQKNIAREEEINKDAKVFFPLIVSGFAILAAGFSYSLSKACGYIGSKI